MARPKLALADRKPGQRADGLYTATLVVNEPTGRRRLYFYDATPRKAAAKRDKAKRLADQGVSVLGGREPLGEYLARWWRGTRASYRPRTASSWDTRVGRLIAALGSRPLEALSKPEVEAFLNDLSASGRMRVRAGRPGLSPSTVGEYRAILRKALHDAEREGLILRNVAALARAPRVEHDEPDSLSPEEAAVFLRAAEDDRLHPLFVALIYSGVRLGEGLGLRWSDLDLGDAGSLTVRRSMARIGGVFVIVEPKSRTSRRTVDLHPYAVEVLREWRLVQLRERRDAGAEWQPGEAGAGLVFTDPFGQPLQSWVPNRRFHVICDRADLPSRPLHALRHTAATLALSAGVDLRVVSAMLGHSGIAITALHYAAALKPTRRDAAMRLGDLLGAGRAAEGV